MKTSLLFLPLLVLVAAACGGGVDAADDGTADDGGGAPTGSWELVEGHGPAGAVPTLEGHAITLRFDDDGIGGTAACNQYFGEVTIDGDSIAITGVGHTEMGCMPQAVMDAERAYLDALVQVTTLERSGDRLVLAGPGTELTYERLAPPPTAELTGTRWELDGLVRGSGPDGAVSSVQGEGHLVLGDDGTLEGSTGCRRLTGSWVEEGDTIRTTALTAEGDCPPRLQGQDGQVVEVLERFRADVDGRRLTLTGRDGQVGLVYRAAG